MDVDAFRIVMLRVQWLSACAFDELTDSMFSEAVLIMSVDATKRDSLLAGVCLRFKFLGVKDSVIRVAVLDCDTAGLSIAFKGTFGFDRFGCESRFVQVNVA